MSRTGILILLLIFSNFSFVVISNNSNPKKIKSITHTQYNKQNSTLVKTKKETFHYDSLENIVLSVKYKIDQGSESVNERFKYEYDENGNLAKEFRAYRNSDFINPYKYYHYNINQQLLSIHEYSSYELAFITLLDYDRSFRLIDSLIITFTGGGFHRTHFYYKKDSPQAFKTTGHSSKGKGDLDVVKEFEFKRNRIKTKRIKRKNEGEIHFKYIWKNDKLKSIVKNKINRHNFFYREDGLLIREDFVKDDKTISFILIEYDDFGNWKTKYYIKERNVIGSELKKLAAETDFSVSNNYNFTLLDTFKIEKRLIGYFD